MSACLELDFLSVDLVGCLLYFQGGEWLRQGFLIRLLQPSHVGLSVILPLRLLAGKLIVTDSPTRDTRKRHGRRPQGVASLWAAQSLYRKTIVAYGLNVVRIQLVAATHALNLAAGVS